MKISPKKKLPKVPPTNPSAPMNMRKPPTQQHRTTPRARILEFYFTPLEDFLRTSLTLSCSGVVAASICLMDLLEGLGLFLGYVFFHALPPIAIAALAGALTGLALARVRKGLERVR
jgi:hypothetical protein